MLTIKGYCLLIKSFINNISISYYSEFVFFVLECSTEILIFVLDVFPFYCFLLLQVQLEKPSNKDKYYVQNKLKFPFLNDY